MGAMTLVARWRRGGEVRLWDGDGVKVLVKVAAVVVMCDGCWPESGRDLGRKNGGGAGINGEREGACRDRSIGTNYPYPLWFHLTKNKRIYVMSIMHYGGLWFGTLVKGRNTMRQDVTCPVDY
ncbi:hypothetical protein Tco_1551931 [Tanacetum coccineum]